MLYYRLQYFNTIQVIWKISVSRPATMFNLFFINARGQFSFWNWCINVLAIMYTMCLLLAENCSDSLGIYVILKYLQNRKVHIYGVRIDGYKTTNVDVISGAFESIPRSALEKWLRAFVQSCIIMYITMYNNNTRYYYYVQFIMKSFGVPHTPKNNISLTIWIVYTAVNNYIFISNWMLSLQTSLLGLAF